MMAIRRFGTLCLALFMSAALSAQPSAKKDEKKRSKQEQAEIEQIVKMVDGVMAGQPGPTDVQMSLQPFFLKSAETRTFVPFILSLTNAPATDVVTYIRVVNPAAKPDPKAKKVEYPWDDIQFLDVGADGRVSRALSVSPGEYELFIGMKEKSTGKKDEDAKKKTSVFRRDLSVPDFTKAELQTSSVILAEVVEQSPMLDPEAQRAAPYTFGTMKATLNRWIGGETSWVEAAAKPKKEMSFFELMGKVMSGGRPAAARITAVIRGRASLRMTQWPRPLMISPGC